MDPVSVIRAYVDALNRCDWATLQQLLAPAFRRHSLAAGSNGEETAAEFMDFLKSERTTYPDAQEELLLCFASGDMVAARHQFRGTQLGWLGPHAPTGRPMKSFYITLYRIEGDRIAESWAEWDNLSDLRQLGHS